mmetsp:Transcript_24253/g.38849  ORF Transcript_24253/g.38849 Transcript_24253/m.38849 type:complete len:257 (+) Transcript_24253:612-1382(+)
MLYQPAQIAFSTSSLTRAAPSLHTTCTASRRRRLRRFRCSSGRNELKTSLTSSNSVTSTNSSNLLSSLDTSKSTAAFEETVPKRRRCGKPLKLSMNFSKDRPRNSSFNSETCNRTTFLKNCVSQLKGKLKRCDATKKFACRSSGNDSSVNVILRSAGAWIPGPQSGNNPAGSVTRCSRRRPGKAAYKALNSSSQKPASIQKILTHSTSGMIKSSPRQRVKFKNCVRLKVSLRRLLSICLSVKSRVVSGPLNDSTSL